MNVPRDEDGRQASRRVFSHDEDGERALSELRSEVKSTQVYPSGASELKIHN